MHYKVN